MEPPVDSGSPLPEWSLAALEGALNLSPGAALQRGPGPRSPYGGRTGGGAGGEKYLSRAVGWHQ